jgi:antitoxin CcdA
MASKRSGTTPSTIASKRRALARGATKQATNLSVNAALLKEARELGVNLSGVLEDALAEVVRRRRAEAWLEQNRAAIDAYNDHVERRGVFSDGTRTF